MKLAQSMKAVFAGMMIAGLAACSTDRTVGTTLTDTAISAKVKAALAGDPDVKARNVQVETYKGTVQLSGFVDSPSNVTRAVDLARRVDGVREVQNALIVK